MRRIHPASAPFSEALPGCQRDGIIEGPGFWGEIPREDRAVIEQQRDTMIRVTRSMQNFSGNPDLAEQLAALFE
jgi:hypothetical protein